VTLPPPRLNLSLRVSPKVLPPPGRLTDCGHSEA
jgi:hypothetical protein